MEGERQKQTDRQTDRVSERESERDACVYVCRRAAGDDLFKEELILKPHLPPEIQSTSAFSVLIFGERTVWEPHSHLMKDDDFLADEASDEASDEEEEEEEQEQEGTENDQSLLQEAKMLARSSSSRRAVRCVRRHSCCCITALLLCYYCVADSLLTRTTLLATTTTNTTRAAQIRLISRTNCQSTSHVPMLSNNFGVNVQQSASAAESAATSVGSSTEDELAEDLEPSVSVNL